MLLDGSLYQNFYITCHTAVQNLEVKNISPGQLYVFVLTQDAIGHHPFAWGTTVRNATPVNLEPEGITVQSFVGRRGFMTANLPGVWPDPNAGAVAVMQSFSPTGGGS